MISSLLCTEPAALVFPSITTIYFFIFVPELLDNGRLCKGALVVLMGFPYILLAFEANPFGARSGRSDVGGDTNLPRGVRFAI
jgi:hypothetical protein